MGPLVAAGLIGAGSNLISGFQSRANVDDTIRANKELAEYQYSKDLEMWNKGNLYNSPSAQMARLKEAGLNPNLVYGHGATGNMATQLPKYSAPTVDYSGRLPVANPMEMLSVYQDIRVKQAQIDNMESQRDVRGQDVLLKELENQVRRNAEGRIGPSGLGALSGLHVAKSEKAERDWMIRALQYFKEQSASPYYDEVAKYEADYKSARVRQQVVAMDKMMQDTELVKKKSDWFIAQAIAKMGGDIFGAVSKMVPYGRGARGAAAAASGTFRRNARTVPSRRQGPYWSGYSNYKKRNP